MKILVDAHCDTLGVALDKKINLDNKELSFNLQDAIEKRPMIQMLATFVNPKYQNSFERANQIIKKFYQEKEKFSEKIVQITNKEQIQEVMEKKQIGLLLTIENGEAIGGNLGNIEHFYNLGIRVMSITWNENNSLGCGALTKQDEGLTNLGRAYVTELNKRGIIIDVSHSSQNTFWDTIKQTTKPVVATHSCAYKLCNHPRNLKDEQIAKIAQMGGIIGVCYCSQFLSQEGKASSRDIAKHISYIANLVGVDYVGLGSDFDGLEKDEMPTDIKGIKDVYNIEKELKNIGFHEEEIEKIMGKNWIRVLKEQL